MSKKTLPLCIILLLLSFAAISQDVSAAILDTYTVDSSGSTVADNTFGFDETPFLYMKLTLTDSGLTQSFWNAPGGASYFEMNGPNSDIERWQSLTDWNTRREPGEWTINSNVFYADGATGTSVANFTVTPEPLAMTLFFVGGAPIAASLIRKKKLRT